MYVYIWGPNNKEGPTYLGLGAKPMNQIDVGSTLHTQNEMGGAEIMSWLGVGAATALYLLNACCYKVFL